MAECDRWLERFDAIEAGELASKNGAQVCLKASGNPIGPSLAERRGGREAVVMSTAISLYDKLSHAAMHVSV